MPPRGFHAPHTMNAACHTYMLPPGAGDELNMRADITRESVTPTVPAVARPLRLQGILGKKLLLMLAAQAPRRQGFADVPARHVVLKSIHARQRAYEYVGQHRHFGRDGRWLDCSALMIGLPALPACHHRARLSTTGPRRLRLPPAFHFRYYICSSLLARHATCRRHFAARARFRQSMNGSRIPAGAASFQA